MEPRRYTDPLETTAAPKACPFCHSPDVKTTSKDVNVSTYWRCTLCGQIWNAGRLRRGESSLRYAR